MENTIKNAKTNENGMNNTIYKLVLGDWSGDGHDIARDFLVVCNCDSVKDIQNAYKTSCRKLGVQFNGDDNNYIGEELSHGDPRIIWSIYGEDDMSAVAYSILDKAGCFYGIHVEETDEGRFYIENLEECACLIMNFISLSMPDGFTYKVVRDNYPHINGYWNKNLNVDFGYGLF